MKRILAPIDGSENSLRALRAAADLAKCHDSELIVLGVIVSPAFVAASLNPGYAPMVMEEYYDKTEEATNHIVGEGVKLVEKEYGVHAKNKIIQGIGSTVQQIIETADGEGVDLITIGTRGLGTFKKLLLGSVSSGVVTHSQCNVLVVR